MHKVPCPALAALLAGATLSAQQVFADPRKAPMPLQMAETKALYPVRLDGDPLPDLVVANRGGGLGYPHSSSWFLRNRGQGRLENVTPADPQHVRFVLAVADLDGDGDADLLFANEITGAIGIGDNDGAGRITWREDVLPGVFAASAVAADLDGDGDADVCTGTRLWLQQGSGGFAEVTATHLPALSFSDAPALALGDVDGDGDPDLVLGNASGQDLLLRNDGSGRFRDDTATAMPANTDATHDLELVDLDGDSDLDCLRACTGVPPQFYRNHGGGVFALAPMLTGSYEATAVAAADVDADGDLDVALGLRAGGVLLVQNPSGFRIAGSAWTPGAEPTSALAFCDLDGDGDADLLQGSGREPGSLRIPVQPSGLENRTFFNDGAGSFLGPSLAGLPLACSEPAAVAGDFDGDGNADVLYGAGAGSLLSGDGFGGFVARSLALPVAGRPVAGDLDGDSDLDAVLVETSGRFHVLDNPGDGALVLRATYQVAGLPSWATLEAGALGDLDGDGDLDLALVTTGERNGYVTPVADALWSNAGNGAFADASNLLPPVATSSTGVALGDLDGDGDLDIATSGGSIYFNQGSTFRRGPLAIDWNYGESHIALGDLDGDSDLDLVAGNACRGIGCAPSGAGGWDVLHYNDGTGTFGPGQVLEYQSSMASSVATGDFDGDGDLDVAIGHLGVRGIGHDNPPGTRLYLNLGGRQFLKAGPERYPLDFDDNLAVLAADADGDGDRDLLLCNRALPGGAVRARVYVNLHRHLLAPYYARLGRHFALQVHGAARGAGVYASLGPARVPVPPLGTVGLDPGLTVLLAIAPPPAAGRRADLLLPVPSVDGLAGVELWLQALVFGPDLASSRLTNRLRETLLPH